MHARPAPAGTLRLVPSAAPVPAGPETPAPAGLGVLEKAMSLLNIVSAAPAPMTFTELLRAGHLPKATLHRILATLMREGLLTSTEENWTLRVKPGPFDVLIGQIPWTISHIVLAWLDKPMLVEWK